MKEMRFDRLGPPDVLPLTETTVLLVPLKTAALVSRATRWSAGSMI
jgi:hypothetical protein